MKKSWLAIVVIIILAGVMWGWSAMRPDATVYVVHPRVESIRAYVEEQAVTELPHDALVAMPIAGWLERIDLREGDAVQQNQVVARLETDDLADRVRQAELRVAVLETKLRETADHRLEESALVETEATVKAIDHTVEAAEAKLEASLAVLEFARAEVDRLRALVETGATSDRELREAETAWRKARAEYRSDGLELAALKTIAAVSYIGPKFIRDYIDRKSFQMESYRKQLEESRAQLEIEKRNRARAEIKSPVAGVVLQRHQTRRQFLAAGTPLLTIGRLEHMEVVTEVLTQRATRIAPGDAVDVFGEAIPEGPIRGTVLRVYPAGFKKISSLGVEQQRVKVAIKLDQRPPRLGVGFRVHVRIYYEEAVNAVTVPRTALFRGDDGTWQVMRVSMNRTLLQAVEVGLMNDDRVQITEGLTAGDVVVARPSREIVAGLRVETNERE